MSWSLFIFFKKFDLKIYIYINSDIKTQFFVDKQYSTQSYVWIVLGGFRKDVVE